MRLAALLGSTLVLASAGLLGASQSYELRLEDWHLNVIPRTASEVKRISAVLQSPSDFSVPNQFERMSAGAATVGLRPGGDVFSQPSGNIDFDTRMNFELGHALFEKIWVSSPSSTKASDGLGPLYNARACSTCHISDGRGHPPEFAGDDAVSMLLRVGIPGGPSVEGIQGYLGTLPDPNYGGQIQDISLAGHVVEGQVEITYEEIEVELAGGETVSLRKPTYGVSDLGFGPLHPDAILSPRVAPQIIGLGLLEAIPAADILAKADPEDRDGDGISGRPNIVWSIEDGAPMLGRFGHKAGSPTLLQQTASAFAADIGISNPLFTDPWGDCTEAQSDCRNAHHGDGDIRVFEIERPALELVTFYARNLGVPIRRDHDDPTVLRGKELFHDVGCASCHTPAHVTHRLSGQPEQSFQLIWPYTDLLLHDMGPGLADGFPEARATGQEWRTPPLWGIGLTQQVSGHTYFLHDGRARSLLEAIIWHGGEAQASRDAVVTLPPDDRAALIRFLESL